MKSHCVEELEIRHEGPDILIQGPLTQETVMSALSQCAVLITPHTVVKIDLKAVTDCDSAGLALLIALMRYGKRHGNTLSFSNPPKQLMDLSQVSGLNTILPVI